MALDPMDCRVRRDGSLLGDHVRSLAMEVDWTTSYGLK
jgi:hypothetical protein